MYCHNCGREIPDNVYSCPYCGGFIGSGTAQPKPEPQQEPAQPSERKSVSNFRRIALCLVALVLLVAGCFRLGQFLHQRSLDSTYQSALDAYESGEYTKALELFTSLGTYRSSQSYIEDCKINQKYEDYDPSGLDFEVDYYGMQASPVPRDQIEQMMATFIYGTWYWEGTDEAFVIDPKTLDGQEYRVCAAKTMDDMMSILLYYPPISDQLYRLSTYPSGSDYPSNAIRMMSVVPADDTGATSTAYDKTSAEIDALYAEAEAQERAYEEELKKQRAYSDSEVVNKATEFVKSKFNTTLSSVAYARVSVNSSLVEYDPHEKTYACYMEFSYYDLSNFGVITTYQGYFLYKDANSKLSLIEYSIG